MSGHDPVAVILARISKKGGDRPGDSKSEREPSGKEDHGLESASDDILSAIHDDDPSALVSALCDFIRIHSSMDEEEPDGDEKEEDKEY